MKELLRKYREDLHRIPELGFYEEKTKQYIMDNLKQYRCQIEEPCSTAVCAYFERTAAPEGEATSPVKTIAFRCDMDALLIQEDTGLPFASSRPGFMHACGHDGHMAMMLGLAHEINANLEQLCYNVLLIFQPAEEGGGGGEMLCNSGILEKYQVDRIYAYHLWPGIEKNAVASAPGPVMAKTTEMDIIITGKSSHCASPEQGIDSLYIGCQFLCDIYRMEQDEVPPREFRLLKFGKAESGTIRNIISDRTVFYGTMRCFNMDVFDFMLSRIRQIAKHFEQCHGCRIEINYNSGFPPVVNDAAVFSEVKKALAGHVRFKTIERPYMQAEDFSFYLEEKPGILMFLGIGDTPPLHSNQFDFDEEVLCTGVKTSKILLGIER